LRTQAIIDFQNSIKYYANRNNFYLKLVSEANRKSDWILKTKKLLNEAARNLENANFTNETNNLLAASNKIRLDTWPQWKGDETLEKTPELKLVIKKVINQWAYIPELKSVEEELNNWPVSPSLHTAGNIKNYYSSANGK
jgi:hypothetical protein